MHTYIIYVLFSISLEVSSRDCSYSGIKSRRIDRRVILVEGIHGELGRESKRSTW